MDQQHLRLIRARGSTWGVPDPDYPDDTIPANRTRLLDMIADIGTNRREYVYDLGDHWSHTIKIIKPMPAVPGVDYPLLIDAVGRCPLEDSGGPPGYMEMLEALRDPAHPRHAEATEWDRVAWSRLRPKRCQSSQARDGSGRPGETNETSPSRIGEAKAEAEAPQAVGRRAVLLD